MHSFQQNHCDLEKKCYSVKSIAAPPPPPGKKINIIQVFILSVCFLSHVSVGGFVRVMLPDRTMYMNTILYRLMIVDLRYNCKKLFDLTVIIGTQINTGDSFRFLIDMTVLCRKIISNEPKSLFIFISVQDALSKDYHLSRRI